MSRAREPLSFTHWTELRMFLEVAAAKSFNKAGHTGTSHAKVGRAVRRLEEELGVQLISEAYARGVQLTPAGEHLARELAPIDRQLARALTGLVSK